MDWPVVPTIFPTSGLVNDTCSGCAVKLNQLMRRRGWRHVVLGKGGRNCRDKSGSRLPQGSRQPAFSGGTPQLAQVAAFTCLPTWQGFVIDLFARRVSGGCVIP